MRIVNLYRFRQPKLEGLSVDKRTVILTERELWKKHYDQAVEQGNDHFRAVRYANLMAR